MEAESDPGVLTYEMVHAAVNKLRDPEERAKLLKQRAENELRTMAHLRWLEQEGPL